jgi:hypothetical protein
MGLLLGRPRSLLAPLTLAVAAGCGGGGGGAVSSPDAPVPVVRGLDFAISPMIADATTVEFRWQAVSGATRYRLEVGSSPGALDVAALEVAAPATSLTWSHVPVGTFHARAQAWQGATAGPFSAEVLVGSIDPRLMIDALVFGRGPLAVAGNAAGPVQPDRMEGWLPGSTFTLVLAQSMSVAFASAAEEAARQIGPATQGAVQAAIAPGRPPDPLPPPAYDEVTLSMLSPEEVKRRCGCDRCVGCARTWHRGSFATRAEILCSSTAQLAVVAHEIGHVVGLAHIISAKGVRPPFTMGVTTDGQYAPEGQLDVLDPATVRMLQTLYGAGLTAGAERGQFEAAGFVPPEDSGASAAAQALGRRARSRGEPDGDETFVVKPFCEATSVRPRP